MAKREKKVLILSVSRNEAEESFAEYAKAEARIKQINAKMDVEITKIREKHQTELADLQEEKTKCFEILQNFAENNRDEFGKKKSLDFTHGVLGFRTSTPALKNKKGFTWNSVTNLIAEFCPTYLRTKQEPDKERLLADRDSEEMAIIFDKIGVCVVQDETFFVEAKSEEI